MRFGNSLHYPRNTVICINGNLFLSSTRNKLVTNAPCDDLPVTSPQKRLRPLTGPFYVLWQLTHRQPPNAPEAAAG